MEALIFAYCVAKASEFPIVSDRIGPFRKNRRIGIVPSRKFSFDATILNMSYPLFYLRIYVLKLVQLTAIK